MEIMFGFETVLIVHRLGDQMTITAVQDGTGNFGTSGNAIIRLSDSFAAFRRQVVALVSFFRTGKRPFPQPETIELMAILIGAVRRRQRYGGRAAIAAIIREIHE